MVERPVGQRDDSDPEPSEEFRVVAHRSHAPVAHAFWVDAERLPERRDLLAFPRHRVRDMPRVNELQVMVNEELPYKATESFDVARGTPRPSADPSEARTGL